MPLATVLVRQLQADSHQRLQQPKASTSPTPQSQNGLAGLGKAFNDDGKRLCLLLHFFQIGRRVGRVVESAWQASSDV